jgi:glutathione S-transferase
VRQYLRAHFFPDTPDGSPDRAAIDAALPKMEQQFGLLDQAVARTGYLVGDSLTLADINLLPILFYMAKMPESAAMLRRATKLDAYYRRHWAQPSAQEAAPPPFPGRQA